MRIEYGPETIVSQATPDVTEWGRWQFPFLYRVGDAYFVEFDDAHDSAEEYGKPKMRFRSDDRGATWRPSDDPAGVALPDGSLLRPHFDPPVPMGSLALPEKLASWPNYALTMDLYRPSELPAEHTEWKYDRWSPYDRRWRTETAKVDFPDLVMSTDGSVLVPNFFVFHFVAPDGALWGVWYGYRFEDGRVPQYVSCAFFKSDDLGRSFREVGSIRYRPEVAAPHDPLAVKRNGFTEPDLAFTGDGRAFSVMRTMDGLGQGPSFIAWSEDGGATWGTPEWFDSFGVWPRSVNLAGGAVLLSYGRPKTCVRVWKDGAWSERAFVPGLRDSCSYTALAALPGDGNEALLAYSDFSYPNADGVRCKTILARKVRIED